MTYSKKKLELSFTHLEFLENMVISTVKEDVVFEESHAIQLGEVCNAHFEGEGFVYIANRRNNYNVNPMIYIDLLKIRNLKGIAIVSNNFERLKTANFERKFSPVPFELFENQKEAIAWASAVPNNN